MTAAQALNTLASAGVKVAAQGFILHVGGNQWYKNREGVIEIYLAYARSTAAPMPLLMIGEKPTAAMLELVSHFVNGGSVQFVSGLHGDAVCAAYSLARLLVWPSLAEGFGWPIAEAMACGCPVLTTNEAPMTEVGGEAAIYIPKRPVRGAETWAARAALELTGVLDLPAHQVALQAAKGCEQAKKFDTQLALNQYEAIYRQVLADAYP